MLHNLFNKTNSKIITVKTYDCTIPEWGGSGVVFYVKNGKGLLASKYGYLEDSALCALMYGNVPLIKFQSNEPYFCPTCEKLVAAGYGLDMSDERVISDLRETFNQEFLSIEHSIDILKPLLGLLSTGYYALADCELYPTNGNGEFFWKIGNTPILNEASCQIHDVNGVWSSSFPNYILPTQPPTKLNMEQVELYRKKEGYRAVAFYLEGYLCALIDGHHKAVAAALDGKKLKALVIIPSYPFVQQVTKRSGISIGGVVIYEDELITPIKEIIRSVQPTLPDKNVKELLAIKNKEFDLFEWPQEILDTAKYFPDALTTARIEWAGSISDSRLTAIVKKEVFLTSNDALNIITALYYLHGSRFKELAFFFCKDYSYVSIWRDIYKLLANIKDKDVEDFFIKYLLDDDRNHPDIKEIVDNYFNQ